jgi:hypothetical protein
MLPVEKRVAQKWAVTLAVAATFVCSAYLTPQAKVAQRRIVRQIPARSDNARRHYGRTSGHLGGCAHCCPACRADLVRLYTLPPLPPRPMSPEALAKLKKELRDALLQHARR